MHGCSETCALPLRSLAYGPALNSAQITASRRPIRHLKIARGCPCAVTALPVGPDGFAEITRPHRRAERPGKSADSREGGLRVALAHHPDNRDRCASTWRVRLQPALRRNVVQAVCASDSAPLSPRQPTHTRTGAVFAGLSRRSPERKRPPAGAMDRRHRREG